MTDTCGAKYPTGLDRCSLDAHDNKTQHKDETSGREWGGKRKGSPLLPGSSLKRGGRLAQKSETQELADAYREGRKDERIHQMIQRVRHAYCEYIEAGLSLTCHSYFTDPDEAKSGLDFAHITRRSQAQGYRSGKGGQNDAHFYLLCRRHHKEYDGSEVRFSGSEEEAG